MSVDVPWRRPGALRYAWARVRGILRPPVVVTASPPGMIVRADEVVTLRDGVAMRVNVHLPEGGGRVPVLVSAHPYGKDVLPRRTRRGWCLNPQFRMLRQTGTVRISDSTGWEAPDPVWWTAQGFAVVNADLRGAGRSEGVGSVMSDAEAADVYDLIEWAGAQEWSSGAVGMLGVSYLAMSQYKAAALRPPALKAICPWEGMTDPYRDLFTPGGIIERGFSLIWQAALKRTTRMQPDLATERAARPLRDAWWESLVPQLDAIQVPILVCASFSDAHLHSRGSFRVVEQARSATVHAWTHRTGKWTEFYGEPARRAQLAFFDRYLRGRGDERLPPVRLEVRERGDRVSEVRDEDEWPLARTRWTRLHLSDGGRLREGPASAPGLASFATRRTAVRFDYVFSRDTEVTGPMSATLWIDSPDLDDVHLFVGAEKRSDGAFVPFEGSYGYGRDRVALGWQRAALREIDPARSTPYEPVHTFRHEEPLVPGTPVEVAIALSPSATLFRAGEVLRFVVAGRPLAPRNPLTGQFPAWHEPTRRGLARVHWGAGRPSNLLIPVIPPGAQA